MLEAICGTKKSDNGQPLNLGSCEQLGWIPSNRKKTTKMLGHGGRRTQCRHVFELIITTCVVHPF